MRLPPLNGSRFGAAAGSTADPTAAKPAASPEFFRISRGSVVAGVCTGLAEHLGVRVLWVRTFFAALCTFPIAAFMMYAGLWVFSTKVEVAPRTAAAGTTDGTVTIDSTVLTRGTGTTGSELVPQKADALSWVLLLAGTALGIVSSATQANTYVIIGGLAILGILLVWYNLSPSTLPHTLPSESSHHAASDPALSAPPAGSKPTIIQWASMLGGVVLLSLSAAVIVFQYFRGAGSATLPLAMLSGVIFLFGCIVVLIPVWLRLWTVASNSQRDKARQEERAKIAARIHDSVLQTLTLIQKQSTEPEIARLARSQERQLRQWLFGADESSTTETVFGAVRVACGEVEDTFGFELRPVFTGRDFPMTERTLAVVMAAREAMVNSAKHSGCSEGNVFVETQPDRLEIFVRDRGPGFEVHEIPQDRYGVRRSIYDRVHGVGGTVEIESGSFGTEVSVVLPLSPTPSPSAPVTNSSESVNPDASAAGHGPGGAEAGGDASVDTASALSPKTQQEN